jgi:hypothetical protein
MWERGKGRVVGRRETCSMPTPERSYRVLSAYIMLSNLKAVAHFKK